MEHSGHLVEGQQRRSIAGRLREIANIVDDRTLRLAVGIDKRTLKLAHPRTLALRSTGEIVGHEHRHMLPLEILHLIHLHFVVILRSIGQFGECHSIESFSHREYTLSDVFESEIAAHLVLVESILVATHLFGIVIVIPRSDLEVIALLVGESLHFSHLLMHPLYRRLPYLHEQTLGIGRILGHHIGRHIRRIVGITEQTRLLRTQLNDLLYDRTVVKLA